MEEAAPDDKEAQLVTPAKAAVVQPSQSAESYVSEYEQDSVSEPSMLSLGSPVATVDIQPAQQQKAAASSPLENGSKQGRDEQPKVCASSPSSRGGSGRELEQPVVPKRGRRKPWRCGCLALNHLAHVLSRNCFKDQYKPDHNHGD